MSVDLAIEIIRRAVMLGLVVAAPMLLTALVVGLIVSLLQAVTQIHEQTLTFIPKLLLVALVLVFSTPWIISRLVEHTITMVRTIGTVVG